MYNTPYHTCITNRPPEEKLSDSKHVEDIKKLSIKILILNTYILLVYVV